MKMFFHIQLFELMSYCRQVFEQGFVRKVNAKADQDSVSFTQFNKEIKLVSFGYGENLELNGI